jgi:hypothetical protein
VSTHAAGGTESSSVTLGNLKSLCCLIDAGGSQQHHTSASGVTRTVNEI